MTNIKDYLFTGAENARTSRDLCKQLDISQRDLSLAIERERRAGAPICASTGKNPGYFLAETKEEMETFCRSLYHRAGEIHKTRSACLKTLDALPAAGEGE